MRWSAVSTSPRPACSPSRSARTRSPTTSPTPRRRATRPTARRSGLRRPAARQQRHRRHRRPAGHRRAGRPRSRPTSRPSPPARPASRWTSRSSARASSPCRPTAARATRATASSRPTPQGRLVTAQGDAGARPQRQPAHGRPRRPRRPARRCRSSTLTDPRKDGDSLVAGTPGRHRPAGRSAPAPSRAPAPTPSRSMVDMISSLRAFEAGQKVIQTIDETLRQGRHAGRRRSRLADSSKPPHTADHSERCSKV